MAPYFSGLAKTLLNQSRTTIMGANVRVNPELIVCVWGGGRHFFRDPTTRLIKLGLTPTTHAFAFLLIPTTHNY